MRKFLIDKAAVVSLAVMTLLMTSTAFVVLSYKKDNTDSKPIVVHIQVKVDKDKEKSTDTRTDSYHIPPVAKEEKKDNNEIDWSKIPLEPKPGVVKTSVPDLDHDVQSLLFKSKINRKFSRHDVNCLAKNIYYEAGVEPDMGKYAVAQVTINRVNDYRFGKTVCGVVMASIDKDDKPVCAFTWVCEKHREPHGTNWKRSVEIAKDFLYNGVRLYPVRAALFYHAAYIKRPYWADPKQEITQIGQHVFYADDKKPDLKSTKLSKR